MALTGIPLLVLVGLAAAGAAVTTAAAWRRSGRLRVPLRVVGVLLTQALVLSAVGLAVNRSEQFYSSWDDLLQRDTAAAHGASAPGRLDQWVRQHDPAGGQPFAFPWRPDGWTAWHLAAPPTVILPPDYPRDGGWRYPVVLVLSGERDGWDEAAEAEAARSAEAAAGPAVLVFARTTPAASVPALAATLPDRLSRDVRVSGHGWALVSAAPEVSLARRVVLAAPGRYPALAVVPVGAAGGRPARVAPPRGLPTGVTVTVPGDRAGTGDAVPRAAAPAASGGADELRVALLWAVRQTPAPLAASAPVVRPQPAPHVKASPRPPRSPAPPRRTAGPAGTSV